MTEILDAQRRHWQETFVRNPDMFGSEASDPARMAAEMFKQEGKKLILELGGGQGRDTIFFAGSGLHITVLDYSESAVRETTDKARNLGLDGYITALQHDVRVALPFADESMDGCYSHMLYCMALTTPELQFLSQEVRRVLRPKGIHRGEDMYEVGGFVVHFFTREKVESLAEGYEIVRIDEFEEGELPRKLFRVTLRKR